MAIIDGQARCDCCGDDGSLHMLTMTWAKDGDLTVTCSFCQGLCDAGMLRPEIVDGEVRYRRWMSEWKPGELIPRVEAAPR